MKKDIHPKYQEVLFVDTATGARFVCGSTLQPSDTEQFEGKKYPVYRVAVSSASHPLYTGSSQLVDSEGRVDKFRKRYGGKGAQTIAQTAAQQSAKDAGAGQEQPKKEQKKPAPEKKAAPEKKEKAKAPAKEKAAAPAKDKAPKKS